MLRLFKFDDESRASLVHRNVYNQQGVLNPTQRLVDGLWEQSWKRVASEPSYKASLQMSNEELVQPAPVRRMVAVTDEAFTGCPPRLPDAQWAPPAWSTELFLKDGHGSRWSMGAVYLAPSYELVSHFLIQEQFTQSVEPDGVIDLAAQPFRNPRELRVAEDPSGHVQGDAWRGRRWEVHATDDAALSDVADSPVKWIPSSVPEGHELLSLPDGMYAILPSQLPGKEAAMEQEINFEFGGDMPCGGQLRRMCVKYAAQARAVVAEVFDQ